MVTEKMIEYFEGDVRRINHALKVNSFAILIGRSAALDSQTMDVIHYAAILHDIGIKESEKKYQSSAGPYQEKEGPPVARRILSEMNVPEAIIERVCFIVGHHHTYSKIDGVDFQILVEADFLVNAYEDEMSREAVNSAVNKVFKTEAGKRLMQVMYQRT